MHEVLVEVSATPWSAARRVWSGVAGGVVAGGVTVFCATVDAGTMAEVVFCDIALVLFHLASRIALEPSLGTTNALMILNRLRARDSWALMPAVAPVRTPICCWRAVERRGDGIGRGVELGDEVVGQPDAGEHALVQLGGVGHRGGGVHELGGADLLGRHDEGVELGDVLEHLLGDVGDGLHVVGTKRRAERLLACGGTAAGDGAARLGDAERGQLTHGVVEVASRRTRCWAR